MDRVKLIPLERAELNDTLALSDLVYEYTERMLGGLLGCGDVSTATRGGALSIPNCSYSATNGTLTFESFQFLELKRGGAALANNGAEAAPEARIIRFNSTDQNHTNHSVDISTFRANGTNYQVYVRSITVDSDTDFRRQWDINSQQEVSASMTTRRRERCEFIVGTNNVRPTESTTAGIGKWVYVSNYVINSGVLTLETVWALDESTERLLLQIAQANRPTLARLTSGAISDSGLGGSTSTGISMHLSAFKLMLWYILESGSSDTLHSSSANANWFGRPTYSLAEIAQRVDDLRTDTNANQTAIGTVDANTTANEAAIDILQKVFFYTANVFMTYDSSTNQITEQVVNYQRPTGQTAADFEVIFDASEVTQTGTAASINTPNEFKKFVVYPCLSFATHFQGATVVSLNVAPYVGFDSSTGLSSSVVNQTATPNAAPINMPWAYKYDGIPSPTTPSLLPNVIPTATQAPSNSRYVTNVDGTTFLLNGVRLALNLDDVFVVGQGNLINVAYVIQATVQKA